MVYKVIDETRVKKREEDTVEEGPKTELKRPEEVAADGSLGPKRFSVNEEEDEEEPLDCGFL